MAKLPTWKVRLRRIVDEEATVLIDAADQDKAAAIAKKCIEMDWQRGFQGDIEVDKVELLAEPTE